MPAANRLVPARLARLVAFVAVVAVALATAPAARAEDQRAEAERYFRTGERLLNAGEFAAAAASFEDAYEILPLPEIAFSAAQAYRLAWVRTKEPTRLKRAVELYRVYLGKVTSGGRGTDATTALGELEPQLRELEAAGRPIGGAALARQSGLMITSEVSPAEGTIGTDPALAGALPLVRELPPGEYEVTVAAKGYRTKTIKATVIAGELVVAIARRGRYGVARELEVGRGETVTLAPPLRTTRQRKAARWLMIGWGLVVGAGLMGLGALGADGDAADLDHKRTTEGITPTELARYEQLRRDRDDLTTAMWTLGGAAVAVGATGLLMYVLDRDQSEAPMATGGASLSVGPAVGDGAAGGMVRGGF